jgi:zinc and cadmium transporter
MQARMVNSSYGSGGALSAGKATAILRINSQHPRTDVNRMPVVLLAYYCALILVASIIGGMIPVWFQLTHRGMQFAVSFVAGVMLGVAVLHMLPHAIVEVVALVDVGSAMDPDAAANASSAVMRAIGGAMIAVLAGILAMFFIERFFSYHHHDVPERAGSTEHGARSNEHKVQIHDGSLPAPHTPHSAHHHLSWGGAALGLALHSVLNGVALAAAVGHGENGSRLAGLGTFLVIFLHKPFDAMTIGMLMARGGWSLGWRHTVNALFALAIPAGALMFYLGLMSESHGPSGTQQLWVAYSLAFSAGTFLCISLSDLLPELQFHHHDRVKLSVAMLLGLAVAWAAGYMESAAHRAHAHSVKAPVSSAQSSGFTNFA